ncbi:pali-domain-containing protein [Suillus occidentalis]|nr:pali-domain-containing protein [Suillus occidentalis]
MSRTYCIPGVFFLFSAWFLLVLVSISLPSFQAMDITRVHSSGQVASGSNEAFTQFRFGIWGYCVDLSSGRTCFNTGHGYSVTFANSQNAQVTIGSSWTRGLAVLPVAACVAFIALLLSVSQHITVTLVASLVSFLAALLTLIAFAINIALYAYVKHELGTLNISETTITGPGFWLTFVSLLLLILAGCTVCFGRRRDRMAGATSNSYQLNGPKGGFLSRFRRN